MKLESSSDSSGFGEPGSFPFQPTGSAAASLGLDSLFSDVAAVLACSQVVGSASLHRGGVVGELAFLHQPSSEEQRFRGIRLSTVRSRSVCVCVCVPSACVCQVLVLEPSTLQVVEELNPKGIESQKGGE
jgi:hypothetical protein